MKKSSFPVILMICFPPMPFLLNWTVAAVSVIGCCSSPTTHWNMISCVNHASNWSVVQLQNGLYLNNGHFWWHLKIGSIIISYIYNYNNNTILPIFLQTSLLISILIHMNELLCFIFLALPVCTFWAACFTTLFHGYQCNGWSNLFFIGY